MRAGEVFLDSTYEVFLVKKIENKSRSPWPNLELLFAVPYRPPFCSIAATTIHQLASNLYPEQKVQKEVQKKVQIASVVTEKGVYECASNRKAHNPAKRAT